MIESGPGVLPLTGVVQASESLISMSRGYSQILDLYEVQSSSTVSGGLSNKIFLKAEYLLLKVSCKVPWLDLIERIFSTLESLVYLNALYIESGVPDSRNEFQWSALAFLMALLYSFLASLYVQWSRASSWVSGGCVRMPEYSVR